MPTVDVINLENQKVGSLELAETVFAAEVNEHLLYESVRHYMAGQRRGTASTKTRHEVAGSGKKLWKQKKFARFRSSATRQLARLEISITKIRHTARLVAAAGLASVRITAALQ